MWKPKKQDTMQKIVVVIIPARGGSKRIPQKT